MIEVIKSDVKFEPHLFDEVDVYSNELKTIITKKGVRPSSTYNSNDLNSNEAPTKGTVVNKGVYLLLIFFLGGLGVHKFYTKKIFGGVMYLLFSWTFIPAFLALIHFVICLFKPADDNGNIIV